MKLYQPIIVWILATLCVTIHSSPTRPIQEKEPQQIEKSKNELNFGCANCHLNASFFSRSNLYLKQFRSHEKKNFPASLEMFDQVIRDLDDQIKLSGKQKKRLKLAAKGVLAQKKETLDHNTALLTKLAKLYSKNQSFEAKVKLTQSEWKLIDAAKISLKSDPHDLFQTLESGTVIPISKKIDWKELLESKRWKTGINKTLNKNQIEKYQKFKTKMNERSSEIL